MQTLSKQVAGGVPYDIYGSALVATFIWRGTGPLATGAVPASPKMLRIVVRYVVTPKDILRRLYHPSSISNIRWQRGQMILFASMIYPFFGDFSPLVLPSHSGQKLVFISKIYELNLWSFILQKNPNPNLYNHYRPAWGEHTGRECCRFLFGFFVKNIIPNSLKFVNSI